LNAPVTGSSSSSSSSKGAALKYSLIAVGVVVLIVVVVVIYRYLRKKRRTQPLLLSAPQSIKNVGTIAGSLAPLSLNGYEYTYSFWMFIQDWSTSNGQPKCVMYRSNADVNTYQVANPSIWMYPNESKLMIRVSTYPSQGTYDPSTYPTYPTTASGLPIVNPNQWSAAQKKQLFNSQYSCDVGSIPLQKWVHVVVSAWDTTMDVYVNGKLARSCLLPGVPVFDANTLQNIYVGQGSTYNGYLSRFKYYNRAVTPNEVYSLYRSGPLPPNMLWNSLKTKIQMSLNISSGTPTAGTIG
jgi:hypothetical protein